MKLFVGLGNPGKKYEKTRHNIGFNVLEEFQSNFSGNFSSFAPSKKFQGEVSEGQIEQEKIILLKPQGFYNTSGSVVKSALNYFDGDKDDLVVIHDDIDLPIGSVRITTESSAAGNNGVKSIIDALGTKAFTRIRIGVYNTTKEHQETADFVLQRFSREDKKILKDLMPTLQEIIVDIVEYHPAIEKVQNIYN